MDKPALWRGNTGRTERLYPIVKEIADICENDLTKGIIRDTMVIDYPAEDGNMPEGGAMDKRLKWILAPIVILFLIALTALPRNLGGTPKTDKADAFTAEQTRIIAGRLGVAPEDFTPETLEYTHYRSSEGKVHQFFITGKISSPEAVEKSYIKENSMKTEDAEYTDYRNTANGDITCTVTVWQDTFPCEVTFFEAGEDKALAEIAQQ